MNDLTELEQIDAHRAKLQDKYNKLVLVASPIEGDGSEGWFCHTNVAYDPDMQKYIVIVNRWHFSDHSIVSEKEFNTYFNGTTRNGLRYTVYPVSDMIKMLRQRLPG